MRNYAIAAVIAIPILALLFVGAGYVHDEVIASERISRGVEAAGSDISRLPLSSAAGLIASYENALATSDVELVVDGKLVILDPQSVGLSVDEDAVASRAMTHRRSAGLANFASWFSTWTSTETVDVPVSFDEESLIEALMEMSLRTIDKPAYDGAVKIVNGVAVAEYPQAGLRIDAEAALPLIAAQLASPDRTPIDLPLIEIEPRVTDGDVDVAVAKANVLIGDQVVLRRAGETAAMVFTPAGLATALRSQVVVNSPATVEVDLDPEVLVEIAMTSADEFTVAPIDATFTFDDETKTLSVVPSVRGQKVDVQAIPDVVVRAALGSGLGAVPMTEGEEAALTTELAEAMGPFGEVTSYTTHHPCCQSRVTNIQLLADEVRGAIVMPGEIFSINDRAGKRTLAEGYVRAGAIIGGRVECCDSSINIGGGTSQFATTLYNAVFFGCYEDVFHQPHSLYFSRYPFVREATLGFPAPDVKFRNDSESVLYIDTTYTPGSITVTFYGNNGGRECTAERSGNTVTRIMKWPDGTIWTQQWTWNYKKPKEDEPTTTTTAPTTTTLPPTTTTLPPTTTVPPPTTTLPPP